MTGSRGTQGRDLGTISGWRETGGCWRVGKAKLVLLARWPHQWWLFQNCNNLDRNDALDWESVATAGGRVAEHFEPPRSPGPSVGSFRYEVNGIDMTL